MIVMKFGGPPSSPPKPSSVGHQNREVAARSKADRCRVRDGQDDETTAQDRRTRRRGQRDEALREFDLAGEIFTWPKSGMDGPSTSFSRALGTGEGLAIWAN